MDAASDGGDVTCNFYRVVRTGLHLFGFPTNTVPATISVAAELGIDPPAGTVTSFTITDAQGNSIPGLTAWSPTATHALGATWNATSQPNGTVALAAAAQLVPTGAAAASGSVTFGAVEPDFSNLSHEEIRYSTSDLLEWNSSSNSTVRTVYYWENDTARGYQDILSGGASGTAREFYDWRLSPPYRFVYQGGVLQSSNQISLPLSIPMEYCAGTNGDLGPNALTDLRNWSRSASFQLWFNTEGPDNNIDYVWKLYVRAFPFSWGGNPSSPYRVEFFTVVPPVPPALGRIMDLPLSSDGDEYSGGWVFVPLRNKRWYEITPSFDHPWRGGTETEQFQMCVPFIEHVTSGFLTEPDYAYGSYIKDPARNGIGYQTAPLPQYGVTNLHAEVVWLAGDVRGVQFTNPSNVISVLSEARATVPDYAEFQTGLHWHQDVQGALFVYDPASAPGVVDSRHEEAWTASPPGSGNDVTILGDAIPDLARGVYLADAPGFNLDEDIVVSLNKDAIIAKRMGARQWITWKGAVFSSWLKWNFDLTVKKTSDPGVSPATVQVIRAQYGAGDQFTPLTAQEAAQY